MFMIEQNVQIMLTWNNLFYIILTMEVFMLTLCLILIFFRLIVAGSCAEIISDKGGNGAAGFFFGLFFGLIGIIIAGCLPKK